MWWTKNARHLLLVACAALLLGCGDSAIDISDSEEDIEEDLYSMVPIGTPKAEVRSALKSRLGLESDDYVSFDYREIDSRRSIFLYEDDSGETHLLYYGRDARIKRDEQGRLMEDEQGNWAYEEEGLPVYSGFNVTLGKYRPLVQLFLFEATVTALFYFDKDDRLNKIVVTWYSGFP